MNFKHRFVCNEWTPRIIIIILLQKYEKMFQISTSTSKYIYRWARPDQTRPNQAARSLHLVVL